MPSLPINSVLSLDFVRYDNCIYVSLVVKGDDNDDRFDCNEYTLASQKLALDTPLSEQREAGVKMALEYMAIITHKLNIIMNEIPAKIVQEAQHAELRADALKEARKLYNLVRLNRDNMDGNTEMWANDAELGRLIDKWHLSANEITGEFSYD